VSLAVTWARRRRRIVLMNLDEIVAVLGASRPAPRRRPDKNLATGRRQLGKAESRARRAIRKARR
jgi:hypothetical protein